MLCTDHGYGTDKLLKLSTITSVVVRLTDYSIREFWSSYFLVAAAYITVHANIVLAIFYRKLLVVCKIMFLTNLATLLSKK